MDNDGFLWMKFIDEDVGSGMLAMLVMMLGISFLKHTDYIVDYFKD